MKLFLVLPFSYYWPGGDAADAPSFEFSAKPAVQERMSRGPLADLSFTSMFDFSFHKCQPRIFAFTIRSSPWGAYSYPPTQASGVAMPAHSGRGLRASAVLSCVVALAKDASFETPEEQLPPTKPHHAFRNTQCLNRVLQEQLCLAELSLSSHAEGRKQPFSAGPEVYARS